MSTSIDKSWMSKPRTSPEYISGVASFIRFTYESNKGVTLFSCPCLNCRNGRGKISLEEIDYHLLRHGIDQSYTVWFVHGENNVERKEQPPKTDSTEQVDSGDDGGVDLVNDAFRRIGDNADAFMEDIRNDHGHDHADNLEFEVNEDHHTKKYKSLLEDAKKPLYPSCTRKQTKLLSTIELYNAKVRHGLSDSSFDDILQIVKSLLPENNTLPENTYKAKKMIRALGMDYEVIHACPNDCILYWDKNEKLQCCPVCRASRWIPRYLKRDHPTKVPEKVLRYFPLIPRLKRLYSVPWIAEAMLWHDKTKPSKEVMRHPVDSPVWSRINSLWPDFASDNRNVRLGLATDGFNPFGNLSSTYSCWPVIIVPYNLPPYCMRKEFSMLSLLIPGPKGPGKDIDVYLQPLVNDLKILWGNGVSAYDSVTKLPFTLKAILMWTIHDFPAYGSLSGCITHGKYSCPVCAEGTDAERLECGKNLLFKVIEEDFTPITSLGHKQLLLIIKKSTAAFLGV